MKRAHEKDELESLRIFKMYGLCFYVVTSSCVLQTPTT